MPIKISLIADVGSVIKGTKDVEKGFDDVAGSLDDLARDAARTGDKLGDGLEAGADQATRSVEKVGRSFADMTRDVSRSSKKAGDALGDEVKKGADKAEKSTDEFKDEARSNFSEVASSFSGDMTSSVDLVQGTLGGLAGSIPGGIGLALGGLGAIAGAFAQQWLQASEDTKQRISDMYDDMVESGNDFLSESVLQQGIKAILLNEEGKATDYKTAVDIAKKGGMDLAIVLRALAGDQLANAAVQKALNDAVTEGERSYDEARKSGEDYNSVLENTEGITGYIDLLARQSTEFDTASAKAESARDATTDYDETLAKLPPEVRTELGVYRDIASEEDARAAYDGLGRKVTKTIAVAVNLDDAKRDIAAWRPVVVGTFRAGKAVV